MFRYNFNIIKTLAEIAVLCQCLMWGAKHCIATHEIICTRTLKNKHTKYKQNKQEKLNPVDANNPCKIKLCEWFLHFTEYLVPPKTHFYVNELLHNTLYTPHCSINNHNKMLNNYEAGKLVTTFYGQASYWFLNEYHIWIQQIGIC